MLSALPTSTRTDANSRPLCRPDEVGCDSLPGLGWKLGFAFWVDRAQHEGESRSYESTDFFHIKTRIAGYKSVCQEKRE